MQTNRAEPLTYPDAIHCLQSLLCITSKTGSFANTWYLNKYVRRRLTASAQAGPCLRVLNYRLLLLVDPVATILARLRDLKVVSLLS